MKKSGKVSSCYRSGGRGWRGTEERIKCSEEITHVWSAVDLVVEMCGFGNVDIFLFICSFSFLNVPAKYTYCSLPEKNTVYFIIISCVSLISFFDNKDKIMTAIFIFTHFGLNIHHTF